MLAGCGAGGSDAPRQQSAETPRSQRISGPALCARLIARVTGRVRSTGASELSGLVLSREQAGVLWAHNDSGDAPRVLALATDGAARADLLVPGARNVDWEDIALAPAAAGRGVLYLGDIGDNAAARSQIAVYSTPEPRLRAGGGVLRGATAPAQRLTLRYPDGAHDAETLLVDGATDTLTIVTKAYAGNAGVYVVRRQPSREPVTLRHAATLSLTPGSAITAGDVSADGSAVVLRSYERAYVFRRRGAEPLAHTLRRRPCVAGTDLAGEGQGEALALTSNGRAFYTVPEGGRPAIRRYAPSP